MTRWIGRNATLKKPLQTLGARQSLGSQFRVTAIFNTATTVAGATSGLLIARWLAPEGRGHYAGVTTWLFFILVFGELGLSSALVYYVSRNPRRGDAFVRSAAWFLAAVSVPLTAVAVVATPLLSNDVEEVRSSYLLAFSAIPIAFVGAAPIFALQSLSLTRWGAVRLIHPTLFLCSICVAEVLGGISLPLVISLYVACLTIQSLLAWALYINVRQESHPAERSMLRPLLRFGVPSLMGTGPALMNGRIDQLVLSLAVPASDLGRYAVAVSLTSLATPVTSALGNVIFPRLAADPEVTNSTREQIRRTLVLSYLAGFIVVMPLAAASHWLIVPLFGSGYSGTALLVGVLAPGAVLLTTNFVIGDMLRGLGRPAVVARAEVVGAILTVAGLALLIPRFGVLGAAMTSTVVYGVVHVLLRRNLTRRLDLAHPSRD